MKKILSISVLATLLLVIVSCNRFNKPVVPEEYGLSGDTLEYAAERMQSYIDDGKFAGISVLLIKDGEVIQQKQFGYADMEDSIPLNENNIFRIFSMTKPITAVALMTLFDEGKFKLDDKVSDYIPEFEFVMVYAPDEATHYLAFQEKEMTIRNLLTHTSGITYGWERGSFVDSLYNVYGVTGWDKPIGETVKILAELPLKFQPGTKWEYGLSIDVAGYLVEVLSGIPLDEYMSQKIFEPLKMTNTGFYIPADKQALASRVYSRDMDKKLVNYMGPNGTDPFLEPTVHFSGGGGLVSTIGDYARFCEMLVNGGELDGARILQPETVKLIMSDQLPEGVNYTDNVGYGLGGMVNLTTGVYGWGGAASTMFSVDPANKMIAIAFAQMMPSDYSFSSEYMEIVRKALND